MANTSAAGTTGLLGADQVVVGGRHGHRQTAVAQKRYRVADHQRAKALARNAFDPDAISGLEVEIHRGPDKDAAIVVLNKKKILITPEVDHRGLKIHRQIMGGLGIVQRVDGAQGRERCGSHGQGGNRPAENHRKSRYQSLLQEIFGSHASYPHRFLTIYIGRFRFTNHSRERKATNSGDLQLPEIFTGQSYARVSLL